MTKADNAAVGKAIDALSSAREQVASAARTAEDQYTREVLLGVEATLKSLMVNLREPVTIISTPRLKEGGC